MKTIMLAVLLLSPLAYGTDDYTSVIRDAAQKEGVSGVTMVAICTVESSLRPYAINYNEKGGKPSHGLCQLQEATARDMGFTGELSDLYTPEVNARYSARFYSRCVSVYPRRAWAIACYNAGIRGVHRCLAKTGNVCNQAYVQKVEKVIHEYERGADSRKGPYRETQPRGSR